MRTVSARGGGTDADRRDDHLLNGGQLFMDKDHLWSMPEAYLFEKHWVRRQGLEPRTR
jgi:hypothetical protein